MEAVPTKLGSSTARFARLQALKCIDLFYPLRVASKICLKDTLRTPH